MIYSPLKPYNKLNPYSKRQNQPAFFLMIDDTNFLLIDSSNKLEIQSAFTGTYNERISPYSPIKPYVRV
jgi:hypothetical protein